MLFFVHLYEVFAMECKKMLQLRQNVDIYV